MPSLPLPPAMGVASASMGGAAVSSLSGGEKGKMRATPAFVALPLSDQALLLPLSRLPYMSALRPPPELLCIFLEEHKKDLAAKSAKQLHDARRKIDRAKFLGESPETVLAWNALDAASAEKKEAAAKLEKALNRHYRTMSLQLHPDKCGEDKRPAFEALTEARNVLRDAEQRCNYMEEMMSVAGRPDLASIPGLVQKGHNAWVKKYVPGAAPVPTPTTKTSSGKKEKPLQLTGGLVNDTPRKPRIYVQDLNSRQIRVAMPPPTDSSEVGSWATYQFYNYCTRVTVLADDKRVATVQGEQLEIFAKAGASEITVDITLPHARRYDIRWFATLRMGESSPEQNTPRSSESTADLTSPSALRRRGEIGATNELCLRRAGELRSTLTHLRQNAAVGNREAEARHWKLHGAMARGRGAEHRLATLLKQDGQLNENGDGGGVNLPGGLTAVREALAEALPLQRELQEEAERAGKRTALKKFKNHVARTIERGEAEEWLTDVTERELQGLGGEPNRLYQLLIEGRGTKLRFDSLVLDSSALTAAASREDLFTAKQCDALHERAAEAERLAVEEAEKAAREANLKKEQERERLEAQMRGIAEKKAREAEMKALSAVLKQSKMATDASCPKECADPRLVQGAVVLLHSLHSAAALNGGTATVEQLPEEGKCVVRCHADGVLRKVPLKNIQIYSGEEAAPTPPPASASSGGGWSCSVCTFHHEGAATNATNCQVCDAPRQPGEGSWTGVVTAKSSEDQQKQRQGQQQAPKQAVSRISITKQATTKQRVVVTTSAPASSPQRTKAKKPVQQCQNSNMKSPQRQYHQKLRCRDGASCRFLRQGPDVCYFLHTPEEQAAAAKYVKAHAWVERTLKISPAVVGWVIGKGGVHIRDTMEESGAKVWIDQESMGPEEMRIVYVKGKKDCVEVAVGMVKDLAVNAPYVGGYHTVVDSESNEDGLVEDSSATAGTDDVAQQKPAPPAPVARQDSARASPSDPLQRQTFPPQCQHARVEPVTPEPPTTPQEPLPASATPSVPAAAPVAVPAPAPVAVPAPAPEVPLRGPMPAPATVRAPVPQPVHASIATPSQQLFEQNSDSILKPPEPDDMGMPLQLSPSYDAGAGGDIAAPPPSSHPVPAVVSPAPGFSPLSVSGTNIAAPVASAVRVPTEGGVSGGGGGGTSSLLAFLESQKACLKGSPSDFHSWLSESEDISGIDDLAEAVKDDAYMKEVLQPGDGSVGVKGFKRAAFKKAVLAAAEEASGNYETTIPENGVKPDNAAMQKTGSTGQIASFASNGNVNRGVIGGSTDIPTELVCPITHVLMTQDPVLAADGMTYERSAIEMWFERQRSEVEAAQRELMVDPTCQRARSIFERGVLSPVTHTKMPSLALIPNVALRTMARDVSRLSQSFY